MNFAERKGTVLSEYTIRLTKPYTISDHTNLTGLHLYGSPLVLFQYTFTYTYFLKSIAVFLLVLLTNTIFHITVQRESLVN